MPSPLSADHPAQQPEPGAVDALISQAARLRGELAAVRQDAVANEDDPRQRWQRALCDLAVHQLDDLGSHLDQLRAGGPEGLAPGTDVGPGGDFTTDPGAAYGQAAPPRTGSLLSRVGSAEWNLLTDEVSWSEELFQIFGRAPESGPMSLDDMPTMIFADDQALLQGMVTDCLIDGRPIDGEFRIVRTDGSLRTVHMTGEPVLDADGCTASMWAVLRDVSELRRSQRAVRESRDRLERSRHLEQTERRVAVELQEAVLPPWGARPALRVARPALRALRLALLSRVFRGFGVFRPSRPPLLPHPSRPSVPPLSSRPSSA